MLKKMLAVIATLLLLLPSVAAEEANPELIVNGGFETLLDGNPSGGWNGTQIDWGETVSVAITTENVNSGKNAIKIINDGNQNPWIQTEVTSLIPGTIYDVSFWLYAELQTAPEIPVGITLEFYKDDSTDSNLVSSKQIPYTGSTNGRWTHVSETFMLPYEANMVKLYCSLWAEGYAFFDDISLKQSDADFFTYYTSHIFHYTDDETGKASATLNNNFADKILTTDIRANLYILDGQEAVYSKTNITFTNGTANFSYSVPEVLKKKGYAYKIRIEVTNKIGTVLDSYEQNLYKYDRPAYLDKNGIYHDENGKEIVPVIAYHLDTADFAKAKEGGYTMFQVDYGCAPVERKTHRENVLNQAAENGLKGVFCLYYDMKNAAHPDIIANTKKLVAQYKDDPRIFGWLVQDEPLGPGVTKEAQDLLELAYKTIRDIDPNHPIIIADYSLDVFKESVKYCDVFIPNSYGIAPDAVRKEVTEAVKYAEGRPVYPNIGAYSRTGYEAGLPSGARMQHCVYQGFIAGAKGVSVYSFSDAVTLPSKTALYNTPLWEPLCKIFLEELPAFYDLFVHTDESERTETETYFMRKWTKEDGDYYVISTRSYSSITVNISVGAGMSVIPLISGVGQAFSMQEGTLSVTVSGGDAISFKVFSAENTIQILKNGIPAKKLESGWLTAMAPEATARIYACFYEVTDGKELLRRVVTGNGNTLSIPVFDSDKGRVLKVYAWNALMAPTAKPQDLS